MLVSIDCHVTKKKCHNQRITSQLFNYLTKFQYFFLKAHSLCEKLFRLGNANPLCSSTAEIRLNVWTKSRCISKCLDLGEACMKLTARESDGDCLISSNLTTESCSPTAEGTTLIVRQLTCPKPDIVTITAAVDENVAIGVIRLLA